MKIKNPNAYVIVRDDGFIAWYTASTSPSKSWHMATRTFTRQALKREGWSCIRIIAEVAK
jgi:hypothetical protein